MLSKVKAVLKWILRFLADFMNKRLPENRLVLIREASFLPLFKFIRKFKAFGVEERLRMLEVSFEPGKKVKLQVDIDEYTQFYYYGNLFEDDDFALLRILANYKDGVFLDIGANVGLYSLVASTHFHEVHCFEPFPLTRERLQKNIKLNNKENISIHPYALSEVDGDSYITPMPHNLGNNFLSDQMKVDSLLIKTKTLDGVVLNEGFSKIDLIKIDVEGHECSVLKGGIDSIRKYLPDIYIECKNLGTYKKFIDILPGDYIGLNPLNNLPIDIFKEWKVSDVFFTARDAK